MLSEFEKKRCAKLVAGFIEKRRPSPHLRTKIDLAFRVKGQSVEIYEVHPHYEDKNKIIEQPVAKATYNKSKGKWKIFWQRADLKWHSYGLAPEVNSIEHFLEVVDENLYGCFFG